MIQRRFLRISQGFWCGADNTQSAQCETIGCAQWLACIEANFGVFNNQRIIFKTIICRRIYHFHQLVRPGNGM